MRGFILNEDETIEMLTVFKDELEEFIGDFDGQIYIKLDEVYRSVIVDLDEDKYISTSAVVRKIEEFFKQSQFNRDEFIIENELEDYIYIKFKNEG